MQVQKLNDYRGEVANNMHLAIDILHQKHKQYTDEINKYLERHSREQSEIKCLSGTETHLSSISVFLISVYQHTVLMTIPSIYF